MSIKRVRASERVSPNMTARTWNRFVDTANAWELNPLTGPAASKYKETEDAQIEIKCSPTDASYDRLSILGLEDPGILPSDGLTAFQNRYLFEGIQPTASHRGKFAVFLEAANTGSFHLAAAGGIMPCKLQVPAFGSWIQRADIDTTDATRLLAAPEGSAQILWRADPADPDVAETVDAIVRLGLPQNVVVIGKANEDILANQPPTPNNVRVWSDDQTDTGTIVGSTTNGYNITGYLDWMTGGQQISADKELACLWMPREGIWRIMWAECEDDQATEPGLAMRWQGQWQPTP